MAYSDLIKIRDRIKRFLSETVVSGTYSDTELEYYAQDALPFIETDYSAFTTYVITIGTDVSPVPTNLHSVLISLKAASLAFNAVVLEGIADSIAVRAGSIALDTTKSLRSRGIEADRFDLLYKNMVDKLSIDLSGSSGSGYAINLYKEYDNEVSDPLSTND